MQQPQIPQGVDPISIERLNKLHPKVRNEAIALFIQAWNALTGRAKPRITQGLRTFAEQAALYAQGRTTKGAKVTNAAAGSSYHNYGLALDFVLIVDGKEVSWDTVKDFDADKQADWMEVVNIFKKAGWGWGGDFKSITDKPHLERTFGKTIAQLKQLHVEKKTDPAGYVIL